MSHIFVSYVHEDEEQVKKLTEALREHDLEVWLDRDSIFPGMRWRDAIRQAIKNGAYFIACFSAEYEKRDKSYMNEEIMLAVDELRQYRTDRPWFVPVLLSECNVPALSIGGGQTLLDFQWVNLHGNWTSGLQRLLRVLKADEIGKLKEFIDVLAQKFVARQSLETYGNAGDRYVKVEGDPYFSLRREPVDHARVENSKVWYLKEVRELREKYGVMYDPLRLDQT